MFWISTYKWLFCSNASCKYYIKLQHHVSNLYISGGVPFIEQGLPNSSLRASDSASSSISSPTTTDSGLEISAKGTSREDLSDLDQCSSSATTPSSSAVLTGTDLSSPDAQVLWPTYWKKKKKKTSSMLLIIIFFYTQPWNNDFCKIVISFALSVLPFLSRVTVGQPKHLSPPPWSPSQRF